MKDKIAIRPELRFYLSQQEILFAIFENAVEKGKNDSNYMENESKLLKQFNYFSGSNIPSLIIRGIRFLHDNQRPMEAIDREAFLKLSEKEQHELAILLSIEPEERDELCEPFSGKLKPIIDPVNILKKIIQAELNAQVLRGEMPNIDLFSLCKSNDLYAMKFYVEIVQINRFKKIIKAELKMRVLGSKLSDEDLRSLYDSRNLDKMKEHIEEAQTNFLKKIIQAKLDAQALRGDSRDEALVELSKSMDLYKMKEYVGKTEIDKQTLPKRVSAVFELVENSDLRDKVKMEIQCYRLTEALRFYTLKDFIKAEFKENFEEDKHLSAQLASLVNSRDLAEMKKRAWDYLQLDRGSLTEKTRDVCAGVAKPESIEKIEEVLQFYALKESIKAEFKEGIVEGYCLGSVNYLLESKNLAQMKIRANISLECGIAFVTERTQSVFQSVSELGSIADINKALYHRIHVEMDWSNLIKDLFKNRSKNMLNSYLIEALSSNNLAEMKFTAKSLLKENNVLSDELKSVLEIILDSRAIEEIRERILLEKLKKFIKAELKTNLGEGEPHSDQVVSLLTAESLDKMKGFVELYINSRGSALAVKTRHLYEMVAKLCSIDEITMAISFHTIKEFIKVEIKKNGVEDAEISFLLALLVEAQDLAEMKRRADSHLQKVGIDLPEKVKKVCEMVTDFDSIKKIKEALLFHSLKEDIKSNLKGLEGPYVDLLMNAHNLDRLKECAEHFLKNTGDLPQEVKIICKNIMTFHSIEEIQEALRPGTQLALSVESRPSANQGAPRNLNSSQSTRGFFQPLPQGEPVIVQVEVKRASMQPGGGR